LTRLANAEETVAHYQPKLSEDERRNLVLEALAPGVHKTELARKYGISRARLYQILDEERTDAEVKLRRAEEEAAYRRLVLELA